MFLLLKNWFWPETVRTVARSLGGPGKAGQAWPGPGLDGLGGTNFTQLGAGFLWQTLSSRRAADRTSLCDDSYSEVWVPGEEILRSFSDIYENSHNILSSLKRQHFTDPVL